MENESAEVRKAAVAEADWKTRKLRAAEDAPEQPETPEQREDEHLLVTADEDRPERKPNPQSLRRPEPAAKDEQEEPPYGSESPELDYRERPERGY